MCGIACVIRNGSNLELVRRELSLIDAMQKHRGPDDSGSEIFTTPSNLTVGLGHQRLSILDLSAAGHQPMTSNSGRFVLSFNGEIYNYLELAAELKGDPTLNISSGDTAVVLAAIERWGTQAFARFNGMWAMICFDRQENRLIISRDPFGQKPLYYYRSVDKFVLASELKSILSIVSDKFDLNKNAVANYLRHSLTCVDQQTFFKGVYALPASSFAVIELDKLPPAQIDSQRYWHHPAESQDLRFDQSISPKMLCEQFMSAVESHMRADVPVGVLLSGGVDSSAILAAAVRLNGADRIRALSVVSDDPAVDESYFIDLAAKHVGCKVDKINLSHNGAEILDLLPQVCWQNDGPVVSLSTVAHYKLMQQAKLLGFKVLLNGQGADEQLGGYGKFFWFFLREQLTKGHFVNATAMFVGAILNRTVLSDFKLREAKRYVRALREPIFRSYAGQDILSVPALDVGAARCYSERELLDLTRFSLPLLLNREDRMSMASSVEMRVPFLDKPLAEMLARIAPAAKLKNGWTKHIFRKAIEGMIPSQIAWRRDKKGFTIPERKWFLNDYNQVIQNTFSNEPLLSAELGFITRNGVLNLYKRFQAGDPIVSYKDVLNLYCLEIFIRQFSPYLRCSNANMAFTDNRATSNAF